MSNKKEALTTQEMLERAYAELTYGINKLIPVKVKDDYGYRRLCHALENAQERSLFCFHTFLTIINLKICKKERKKI